MDGARSTNSQGSSSVKKVYDVLTTDCVPIGPPMPTVPFHDFIRILDNDGDVDDFDTDTLPVATPHNNVPNTP